MAIEWTFSKHTSEIKTENIYEKLGIMIQIVNEFN